MALLDDLIKDTPIEKERYSRLVIKYIRERYTIDEEIAILRQRDTKIDEFNEYNTYVEECKLKAKGELNECKN